MKDIKIISKNNKKAEENLKVAAYVRVSTEQEDQEHSFESQRKYYYEKINNNPSWNFVGVYADEGISGTSINNRTGFIEMINAALNGKIDLILTKSVSRFARNTIDTIEYIRILKEKNIAIYFEEEEINTRTMQGEFLITILSSISQQESENISSHIIAGRDMGIRNNNFTLRINGYGYNYDKNTKITSINEEQAKVVKIMFEWFIEGKNVKYVYNKLKENNIKSPSGNEVWKPSVIRKILKNEKYIGDMLYLKNIVINPLTHKRKLNNGLRDQYYFHDHHTPIVSKEIFYKAQEIFKETAVDESKYAKPKTHLLAYKSTCGFCNNVLRTIENIKHPSNTYQCRRSSEPNHFESKCLNARKVKEDDIKICFNKIISKLKKQLKYSKFNDEIEYKLIYIRNVLKEDLCLGKLKETNFNEKLFNDLILNVTLGGLDKDGNVKPYLIRFILKENNLNKRIMNNFIAVSKKTIILLKDKYTSKLKYKYRDKALQKEINENGITFDITLELLDEECLIWKL